MSKKVLVVVDVQNDFIYGPLGSPEARAIVPNVVSKVKQYLEAGHEVYYTKDTHSQAYMMTLEGRKLPVPHCIEFTKGWEIIPELKNLDSDAYDNDPFCDVVHKVTFGYSDWNQIMPLFPESIEIIGVCTDICVVSNTLIIKSIRPETEIIVDASCCAGTTPENHQAALQVMKCCHINVIGE